MNEYHKKQIKNVIESCESIRETASHIDGMCEVLPDDDDDLHHMIKSIEYYAVDLEQEVRSINEAVENMTQPRPE